MAIGISTNAVMFFNDGDVVKEMLYPEFEAILDQVVGVVEFAGKQIPAAYVRINGSLCITHVVLFLISFDGKGYVDKSWNIPLSHLAESAGKGPDLGAGPIKLSCRSQCSVSWHQRALWDPDAHAGNTTLKKLVAAAKRNRLGLTIIDESEPVESPSRSSKAGKGSKSASSSKSSRSTAVDTKALEKEITDRLSKKFQEEIDARVHALKEEHRLRVATMKSEAQEHIEKMQALYRSETQKVKETLETTKHLFAEEKQKNLRLKQTLDENADELKRTRETFQKQLQQTMAVEQGQLVELERKFELESKAKVDAAIAELKERLDMREVELFYRDEQVSRLNDEIAELRKEKQNLLDSSGDRLLKRLVDGGITFVAYQPGFDHIDIPVRDIAQYIESPIDYVAEKCAVDSAQYKQWVAHSQNPVCTHRDENGVVCGEPLAKVEKPGRFITGESDRCAKHNRAANTLSTLMKARRKT